MVKDIIMNKFIQNAATMIKGYKPCSRLFYFRLPLSAVPLGQNLRENHPIHINTRGNIKCKCYVCRNEDNQSALYIC